MTNVGARYIRPEEIREWDGDLWLFPRYGSRRAIPLDSRHDGPAHPNFAGK
jgi:hypothetical protein